MKKTTGFALFSLFVCAVISVSLFSNGNRIQADNNIDDKQIAYTLLDDKDYLGSLSMEKNLDKQSAYSEIESVIENYYDPYTFKSIKYKTISFETIDTLPITVSFEQIPLLEEVPD